MINPVNKGEEELRDVKLLTQRNIYQAHESRYKFMTENI